VPKLPTKVLADLNAEKCSVMHKPVDPLNVGHAPDDLENSSAIETSSSAGVQVSASYLRFVIMMTMSALTFSYMDRQIIGILLQAIKVDLRLSDTALGLLGGIAFGIFYGAFSMPIARLADTRARRRDVVAIAIAVWSLMTTLCGTAQNFVQLFLCRVGVGVGEAGSMPASYSLISDYFPKERRARVISICGLGLWLGSVLGLVVGGWALTQFGWRKTFFLVGIPGLFFAMIYGLTVREPPRGGASQSSQNASVLQTVITLFRIRSYLFIVIAAATYTIGIFGFSTWIPALLIRTYGMTPGEVGLHLAAVVGISSVAGTLSGGFLADYLARHDLRWPVWLLALACLIAFPCTAMMLLCRHQWTIIIAFYSMTTFLLSLPQAPIISMVHLVVPPAMKASAVAFILLGTSIIGGGLGPLIIGILSDSLQPVAGTRSLQIALGLSGPLLLFPAYCFWRSAKTLRHDAGLDRFTTSVAGEKRLVMRHSYNRRNLP